MFNTSAFNATGFGGSAINGSTVTKAPTVWKQNPSSLVNHKLYNEPMQTYNSPNDTYSGVVIGNQADTDKKPAEWRKS